MSAAEAVPQIDEYDPASDSWKALAPMPKGLDHLGVAVIGNTITTVGGFIGSVHRGAVNDVYQYDVTSNTWKTLAPMKAPRASVGVALLDGKIHAVGGRRRRQHLHGRDPRGVRSRDRQVDRSRAAAAARATTWRWSPSTASCTPSAAAPPIRRAGSRSTTSTIPRPISWSSGPPLPTARSGLAYAPTCKASPSCSAVSCRPTRSRKTKPMTPRPIAWRTLAPMPAGRHGTGAAVIGKNLYVAAGSLKPGSGGVTDQLIVFTAP